MSATTKGSLLAIAAGCFALGVVTDRFLLNRKLSQAAESDGGETRPHAAVLGESVEDDLPEDDHDPMHADPHRRLEYQLDRDHEIIDFAEAVLIAQRLPSGHRRRELVERIARRWAREDPQAAIEWASSLTGEERIHAMERAIESWADEDALAALEFVAALPNSERSLDWVHHAAWRLSEQDRPAALEWALGQVDVNIRDRALRGALEQWAEQDPGAAAEFVSTIPGRSDQMSAIEQVAHRWARQDPAAALEWAAELQGERRARATREILQRVSDDDPSEAAAIYEQIAGDLPGGDGREGPAWHIGRELASRWAHFAPVDAANWAMTLPEAGELRRAAVREVTEQWIHRDSIATSEWVNDLENGSVRDSAAEVVAEHSARRGDFESAIEWAGSVSDPEHRRDLTHRVFERWSRVDPEAAKSARPQGSAEESEP